MNQHTAKRVFTGLTTPTRTDTFLQGIAASFRMMENAQREMEMPQVQGSRPGAPPIQWEHHQDYHITLNYLGNLSPEQAVIIRRITRETAGITQTFDLTLDSLELFPAQDQNALVVTVKSPTGAGELHQLQKLLEEKLEARGFEPNQFQYKPHITIAKTHMEMTRVQALWPLRPIPDPPRWAAQSVAIFNSNNSRNGTKYVQTDGWSLA